MDKVNLVWEPVIINMDFPSCCAECDLYDDRWDYPTCFITQKSEGYNFNIFKKKIRDCPLNKIKINIE